MVLSEVLAQKRCPQLDSMLIFSNRNVGHSSDDTTDLPGLMDVRSRWSFSQESAKPNGISKNMRKNKASQGSLGWCWIADEAR